MARVVDLAEELVRVGAVVVSVYDDGVELGAVHDGLLSEIDGYPEYQGCVTGETPRVTGAFGAFGTPGSFHGAVVRGVRDRVVVVGRGVFEAFVGVEGNGCGSGRVLQPLLDRVCLRMPGAKLGGEQWHRDVTPRCIGVPPAYGVVGGRRQESVVVPEGQVFGGWVNLNKSGGGVQKFSFSPGSHLGGGEHGSGFAVIRTDEQGVYKASERVLLVPPGHMVIFYQHIAHKIAGCTYRDKCLRLFCGWHLGASFQPFLGTTYMQRVLDEHESPPIPSGQLPRLFSRNCISIRKAATCAWAERAFEPCLLVEKVSKASGVKYRCIPHVLTAVPPVLKRKGGDRYFAKYTAAQRETLLPYLLGKQG